MTTNATTKGGTKWLDFLRWNFQGPRPVPFWRKRLDDMVEEVDPIEVGGSDPGYEAVSGLWNAAGLLVLGAIFISGVSLLVGAIFMSPGFFEVGIADPLGRWYAGFCVATGQCELGYLLAGTVVGVLVLTLAVLTFMAGFPRETASTDPLLMPDVGTEIVGALGVLDERLVRFRADMVLNGALPLSMEEQEEDEEDEIKEVAKALPAFPGWLAATCWLGSTALMLWMILGPLRSSIVAAGGLAQLLALSASLGLPFIAVLLLVRYDQWVRFQRAEGLIDAPPAPVAYTPGLHPWPNPEEALTDMVKAERLIQKQAESYASEARGYLTSPQVPAREATPITYQRPELTKEDQVKAGQLAVSLTGNKSTLQIRAAMARLIMENQRLTVESNEHRAARGIEPLPTFDSGK